MTENFNAFHRTGRSISVTEINKLFADLEAQLKPHLSQLILVVAREEKSDDLIKYAAPSKSGLFYHDPKTYWVEESFYLGYINGEKLIKEQDSSPIQENYLPTNFYAYYHKWFQRSSPAEIKIGHIPLADRVFGPSFIWDHDQIIENLSKYSWSLGFAYNDLKLKKFEIIIGNQAVRDWQEIDFNKHYYQKILQEMENLLQNHASF